MNKLLQWALWKERCALALCDQETQSELRAFAFQRFRHCLQRYWRRSNLSAPDAVMPSPSEAWHRFESMLCVRNTRAGKSYKEWLFARAPTPDDTLACVEAGASLIMRDVVRDLLRTETAPYGTVSMDTPIQADTQTDRESVTIGELIAAGDNPATIVVENEIDHLAMQAAVKTFRTLTHRQQVALLAQELGISLAHPATVDAAGCGKSVLNTAYHTALRALADEVNRLYANEDRPMRATIAVRALRELKTRTILWGRSEKRCARLFRVIGDTEPRKEDNP